MSRKFFTIWMSFFFLIGAGFTYYFDNNKLEESSYPEAVEVAAPVLETKKIDQALELILSNYVEQITTGELVEGAIAGMLDKLGDPYSVYMDEKVTKQFMDTLDSSFEGIGAEVTQQNGKTLIVSPIKNSPAEQAGLKPKDEIIAVDGHPVSGLALHEVTMKIRGEKGSTVQLTIKRGGNDKNIVVDVIRDEIPNITVHSEMKSFRGKKIGYLDIASFSDNTSKEFASHLQALEKEEIEGLIIDVRDNPGGRLDAVQEIANHFVSNNQNIVQIQQRDGEVRTYQSTTMEAKPYEVVILMNEGSASASEILAAALNETQDYKLVGKTTFGKGTVQQTVSLGDGSTIKLTVYKWLTPDGNWIHEVGVKPTIEVEQSKIFALHPLQISGKLEKDMNNDQIKFAQEILDVLGYSPGRTDGYFSDKTVVAVRAFQQAVDLKVNGVIDEKTAAKLQDEVEKLQQDEKLDLQLQMAIRLLSK